MQQSNLFWAQEITQDNELFTSQIEWVGDFIYLHCTVHKNVPRAIKEVKKELHRLLNRFEREGVEQVYAYIEKGRFAEMIGGRYFSSFYSDGKHYEVYSYATSSSARCGGNRGSSSDILHSATKQGPEGRSPGAEECLGYSSSTAEKSGNAGSQGASEAAEDSSRTDSAGSKLSWSLSEFW